MAGEEKTEEKETELDEAAAKEKKKIQGTQDYLIFKSLNNFGQMYIANIPKTETLSENQAINVYKEIQDDCNQCGFSITLMEQLLVVKLC